MVYARKEAEDTVSGASGVREHDLKVVLETAARVSIAERGDDTLSTNEFDAFETPAREDRYGLVSAGRVSGNLLVSDPDDLEDENGELPTSVHLQNLLLPPVLKTHTPMQ